MRKTPSTGRRPADRTLNRPTRSVACTVTASRFAAHRSAHARVVEKPAVTARKKTAGASMDYQQGFTSGPHA